MMIRIAVAALFSDLAGRALSGHLDQFRWLLVSDLPLNVLGWISVGLIAIGSAFLVPEIKFGNTSRPGAALVEEISE